MKANGIADYVRMSQMYNCINCGKELKSFECDCGKDVKVWNSGLRKNVTRRVSWEENNE